MSVTGGALDFSLTAENEKELLTGLIAASRDLEVWFVSGGSDSGIMYQPHALKHASDCTALHLLGRMSGPALAPFCPPPPRTPHLSLLCRRFWPGVWRLGFLHVSHGAFALVTQQARACAGNTWAMRVPNTPRTCHSSA